MCVIKIYKHLKSVIDNSVVTYDKIIDVVAKSYNKPTNFKEKGNLYNRQFSYLTSFLELIN